MDNLPPKNTVILVASGYAFRCPECDYVGYRPSALERIVSCEQCGSGFPVVEVRHRTGDKDLAPGVHPDALFIPKETSPGADENTGQAPPRTARGRKRAEP
jgi:hypothetical protein